VDKCEAMWNDDYLGRIQNIPVPLLLSTMNPHMKSHGLELKATVTSHLTTWAMALPIFICLNLSSGL